MGVACVVGWVAWQAVQAKDSLERAQGTVTELQASLTSLDFTSLDTSAITASADSFATDVSDARQHANDPLFKIAEKVPMVGPNLTAVRQLTDTLDQLSTQALLPVVDFSKTLTPDAIKPVDGKLNVEILRNGDTTLQNADAAITATTASLAAIDTTDTVGQIGSAKTTLTSALGKAQAQIAKVRGTLTTVEGIVGMNGTRHYLLAFLNNAETTGLGGGPASLSMLTVDNGSFAITDQASSQNFPLDDGPARALDANVLGIYGQGVASTLNWSTSRPDFPTAALTIKAFWDKYKGGETVDGVISVDPLALADILAVTGPVKVEATGDVITADNAVALLLHDVYLRYPKSLIGAETDEFFAEAAKSIFAGVTTTSANPAQLLTAIQKSVDSGNLMAWSANADESALLKGTKLEGVLPTTNEPQTLVGTFFRDVSVSKTDYYLETGVALQTDVCANPNSPTFTQTVTLHSTITTDEAESLPDYVVGQNFHGAKFSTEVYGYGPVGATITNTQVGDSSVGGSARPSSEDLGRPVGRAIVDLAPGETTTVTFTYTGAAGTYGPPTLQGTPMINATQTAIDAPGCK
ncbi:hypothetical protein C5B96_09100 [Subtercola sp. Z020]|uniref:DUF4012 domain-containing protein n=1 Tax=Subtercola sp. Z020 TaxID=2080582 RepID=UPI000CE75776|nr:DUF4012 domain-containing protein [Subtercola sp. Z020]PPF82446.1 hypothetical protein C5B96_09100 [Subtercola sp. Z020]